MPNTEPPIIEFRKRGGSLGAFASAFNVENQAMPHLRQWLDDAGELAQPQDMQRWGHLLLCLLNAHHLHDVPTSGITDAQRLVSYLNAMATLEPQHWGVLAWDSNYSPKASTHDTCRHVIKAIDAKGFHEGHRVFKEALDSGWQPEPLLDKLTEIAKYHGQHEGPAWRKQAHGALLLALWNMLGDTTWRPADTVQYGGMWDICSIGSSIADSTHAVVLSKSAPSQSAQMLESLLTSTNIDGCAIEAFFPLRLESCDALECIKPLVGLLIEGGLDDPSYKAIEVTKQLQRHNPELASLLHMHLTLFPEVTESNTLAELVVPGFNALYGRAVEAPVVLNGDFFDSPQSCGMGASA